METAQAYQWIETTCLADTALVAVAVGGIWESYAPIGTVAPFVVFNQQAGTDVLTLTGVRLWTDILMQIKMIGPATGYASLVAGADRIDALFREKRNVGFASGGVLSCYREQSIAYAEIINGAAWSHLGGLYRIALQGS